MLLLIPVIQRSVVMYRFAHSPLVAIKYNTQRGLEAPATAAEPLSISEAADWCHSSQLIITDVIRWPSLCGRGKISKCT